MKKRKIILAFMSCITISLLLLINVNAENVKDKIISDPKYVNDYAEIVDVKTEQMIIEKNKELEQLSGSQIIVSTVKSLNGESIESYSLDIARKLTVGKKDKNNGVSILISLEDKKARIEVGYGCEGYLTDTVASRAMDKYLFPEFKKGNYDKGISELFTHLNNLVQKNESSTGSGKNDVFSDAFANATIDTANELFGSLNYLVDGAVKAILILIVFLIAISGIFKLLSIFQQHLDKKNYKEKITSTELIVEKKITIEDCISDFSIKCKNIFDETYEITEYDTEVLEIEITEVGHDGTLNITFSIKNSKKFAHKGTIRYKIQDSNNRSAIGEIKIIKTPLHCKETQFKLKEQEFNISVPFFVSPLDEVVLDIKNLNKAVAEINQNKNENIIYIDALNPGETFFELVNINTGEKEIINISVERKNFRLSESNIILDEGDKKSIQLIDLMKKNIYTYKIVSGDDTCIDITKGTNDILIKGNHEGNVHIKITDEVINQTRTLDVHIDGILNPIYSTVGAFAAGYYAGNYSGSDSVDSSGSFDCGDSFGGFSGGGGDFGGGGASGGW